MLLQPIRLLPARERVASVLRKEILSRRLTEGQQLTLEAVAGQLGVSKTPVREAFLLLETGGPAANAAQQERDGAGR